MEKMQVRTRNYEAVADVLAALAAALRNVGGDRVCFIHCLDLHRSAFYMKIEHDFGVHVVASKAAGFKAGFIRFAFGASAMIEIKNYDLLAPMFLHIGAQAMAAVYVTRRTTLFDVGLNRMSVSQIEDAVQKDPTHLIYKVDEDSAAEGNLVVELLSTGEECPASLKSAVRAGSAVMAGAQQ